MNKKYLPFVLLALAILLMALLMPSSSGVRLEPARLTPTPELTPVATPAASPAPTETPVPVPEEYVLRSMKDLNEYHEDVEWMQARLSRLGFYVGKADGFYGRSTFEAVCNFQRMNGLEIDGIAGEDTQRMLFESDTVRNSLGNIYVPFTVPTPSPTPAPTPTPRSIPMDSFVSGSKPNEAWFGGSIYRDNTISANVQKSEEAVTVKVEIAAPYQLRSALAGTYTLPQSLDLKTLSHLNKAVIAFGGTDYTVSDSYEVRQQLVMKPTLSAKKALLVVDMQGKMRLYSPANAPMAVQQLGARIYQAMTVEKALIISGITQTGLSEETGDSILAFGQTGDLSYVLIYGKVSCKQMAKLMNEAGCDNAAVIGTGGIYTCFGNETDFTFESNENVSNILYFASHIEEGN